MKGWKRAGKFLPPAERGRGASQREAPYLPKVGLGALRQPRAFSAQSGGVILGVSCNPFRPLGRGREAPSRARHPAFRREGWARCASRAPSARNLEA